MSLSDAISVYSSAKSSEAYATAYSKFDELLQQNVVDKGDTLTHWGIALTNNLKLENVSSDEATKLFDLAKQKFETALPLSSPNEHVTLLHWGNLYLSQGRKFKASGKNDLALEQFSNANTKFSESFSKQQTYVDAVKAWRESLSEQAKLGEGNQRLWFEAQVAEKGKWIDKLINNEPINLPTKVETSPQDKLKKGIAEKELGNEFFKKGEFTNALKHYHNGLNYANGLYGLPPQDDQTLKDLKISIYNNMAVVHMKQNKNDKALTDLRLVLELDSNNVKALFRRGKLYHTIGEVEKSREELEKAKKLDPSNKEILQEFVNLEKKEKEITLKQKNFYSKMF